jgi:hypothetical protein
MRGIDILFPSSGVAQQAPKRESKLNGSPRITVPKNNRDEHSFYPTANNVAHQSNYSITATPLVGEEIGTKIGTFLILRKAACLPCEICKMLPELSPYGACDERSVSNAVRQVIDLVGCPDQIAQNKTLGLTKPSEIASLALKGRHFGRLGRGVSVLLGS